MGAPTMVVGGWLADTARRVPTVSDNKTNNKVVTR